MKKGLFKYLFLIVTIAVAGFGILAGLSYLSILITDNANAKYMPLYINGEKGYSSPWYKDGLHIVDEGFVYDIDKIRSDSHSVVSIGSSMSRIPFRYEAASLPDDYNYYFLVCGNGCYRSDRIFTNVLDLENKLNPDTIVKYEISFSTFRHMYMTIAESTFGKWGAYTIEDDLGVKKNSSLGLPIYELNKIMLKIQNVGELFLTENNFCNNYFNYDAVAASCAMDDSMCESVIQDINRINDKAVCVVEISPLPNGLAKTEYGIVFENYVDNTLIPYLKLNDIKYFDYRYDYEDSEFADGVHLSYNAGIAYTEKLNEDIGNVIKERKAK